MFKWRKNKFIINEPCEWIPKPKIEENLQNGFSSSSIDLVSQLSAIIKQNYLGNMPQSPAQVYPTDLTGELVLDLLPILDGLERILELANRYLKDESLFNWIRSVEAIHKKMKSTLAKWGLKPIESVGLPVDFNLHEVVEYRYKPDVPENTVIEEKMKGYIFRGRVIRDAKVVVAKH